MNAGRKRGRKGSGSASKTTGEGNRLASLDAYRILQLPINALVDILSRLPIKDVFTCRSVCKAWNCLISHPRFVYLHLSRSPIGILIKTIPYVNETKKLSLCIVEECLESKPFRASRMKLTPKYNLPISKFSLVNSCNGLLCMYGSKREDPIYVCNPMLGEYVTLPPASRDRHWGSFIGLGFCAKSGEYKVLQTFHPKVESSMDIYLEAEVYTLGKRTWRSVGYAPKVIVGSSFNTFLNGALHWVPSAGNSPDLIYAFNFESEKFGLLPPPPHFDQTKKQFSGFLKLGVYKDCLYVCFFGENNRNFDIWVMKDYGIQGSWTKQFVVDNLYPRQSSCDFYEPAIFLSNGEILMLYNDMEVLCYNSALKRLRGTRVTRTRAEFHAIALTPSLVSLFSVAQGEKVTRIHNCSDQGKSYAEESQFTSSGYYVNEPKATAQFDPHSRTQITPPAPSQPTTDPSQPYRPFATWAFSSPTPTESTNINFGSKKSWPFISSSSGMNR